MHADMWEADEVCCPGCGWRRPLMPRGPSVWAISNEHLLDVAVPVLVAAGDLSPADVPAFRQLGPRFPGRLAELLRTLGGDARVGRQGVGVGVTGDPQPDEHGRLGVVVSDCRAGTGAVAGVRRLGGGGPPRRRQAARWRRRR
jgi:hypothetical protein